MPAATDWGPAQDVAYHLERAITKAVGAMLLIGGGLVPQGRAVLREAGDWVQTAHGAVEALSVSGKKRKAAQALALKHLKAAEKEGVAAAKLLFQEKVPDKAVAEICEHVAESIRAEIAALEALLGVR